MKALLTATVIFAAIAITSSCTKGPHDPGKPCVAGFTGHAIVTIAPKYIGRAIVHSTVQPDTVFVRFNNSPDFPPPRFDTFFVGKPGEDHFHLMNLSCGSYYMALSVYDTVTAKRYTGGQALSIGSSDHSIDTTINVN
jgi:hypothetical protein